MRSLQSGATAEASSARIITAFPLTRTFHHSAKLRQDAAPAIREEAEVDQDNVQPPVTFAELGEKGLINPKIIDTIVRRMGLKTMTDVQSLTLNEALTGKDV